MRWVDLKDTLSGFWGEYRRQKAGMFGLVLLLVLVTAAILAPVITSPDVPKIWKIGNPYAPSDAPPTWTNMFSKYKKAPYLEVNLGSFDHSVEQVGAYSVYKFVIPYDYKYHYPPKDIVIAGINSSATVPTQVPQVSLYIVRPHEPGVANDTVKLVSDVMLASGSVLQISSLKDAKVSVLVWLAENGVFDLNLPGGISPSQIPPELLASYILNNQTLFGYLSTMDTLWPLFNKIITPQGTPYSLEEILFRERPEPLQGDYKVVLTVRVPKGITVDFTNGRLIFVGRTYGFMGTDQFGRDIWADLIWGLRVSLYIGFAVSITSVLLGVLYGVTSAYFGGWVDEGMQRFNEFLASIPIFPILVLLGMYFGGHITINLLIALLAGFGWMGTAKVARSMALQIKEQTYIEAARALGASTGRVVFKHIVPQLLPYAFASIALSVPGAILSEAGLSFLGLGDPTAITWGQMLNAAQQNNATLNGYWWQVIPPGLAIALVGFVFVLIGVSLDTVLNPRLKRA